MSMLYDVRIGGGAVAHTAFCHGAGARSDYLAAGHGAVLRDIRHGAVGEHRGMHRVEDFTRGAQCREGHDSAKLVHKLEVLLRCAHLSCSGHSFNDLRLCGKAQDADRYE